MQTQPHSKFKEQQHQSQTTVNYKNDETVDNAGQYNYTRGMLFDSSHEHYEY